MRKLLALGLLMISAALLANTPTVPSTLNICGMTLKLTPDAVEVIQKDVNSLTASQKFFGIKVDRARLYFPIIERIFAEENVPDEIKYLVLQESALISDAVSTSNAVGFWQFKDFTAREVGLRVDRYVDERKNIVSASRGAARYLKRNNFYYNNWMYAIMAYNTGRGGAQQYIEEQNLGQNKMTINAKTHWYVKKFLAHYVAFHDAVKGPHTEGWQLAEFEKGKNRTLDEIAGEFKVDAEKLKEYNKWLAQHRVPDDKDYVVIVPVQGRVPSGLVASHTPKGAITQPDTRQYPNEIIPGLSENKGTTRMKINGLNAILAKDTDDVFTLSAKSGLSEKKFRKFNDLGPTQELRKGEFYYSASKKSKSTIAHHIAKRGETLWQVAQQYGIKLDALAKMNRMTENEELKEGRVLWLSRAIPKDAEVEYFMPKTPPPAVMKQEPAKETAKPVETKPTAIEGIPADKQETKPTEVTESPVANPPVKGEKEELQKEEEKKPASEKIKVTIHTVAAGESLWGISKKYEVSVEDLMRWNELEGVDIKPGQNLQVKGPISERTTEKKINTHTVEKGDTLFQIARKYGMSVEDVMELNGMKTQALSIGQKLKVYDN
jgi:membrane-bound lytic murein transglycosylase D